MVYDEFDVDERLAERGVDGQDVEETKKLLGRELVWKVLTVSTLFFFCCLTIEMLSFFAAQRDGHSVGTD